MDYTTCYCRSPQCPMYGQIAPRAQVKMHDWQRQGPRFRCERCGVVVSATTGTAYVGIRTDLHTYLSGATALAEGLSIRATGRLVRVDKDTVNHWLPVLGQHCQGVMNYFFRNLHLHECQLDELWTFIHKKEGHLSPLEKLAEVYGDAWVWIAFSPVYKVVPAWVVGKRTLRYARRLLFRLKSATDGYIPFFTSDELPHYAHALLEVYGVWDTPPRQGTRGRFPKPRRYPPPDLCYAVVVKERARGRVVHVTTRLVYGTTEQVETALRNGAADVARESHHHHLRRGAPELDRAPTLTQDAAYSQGLLQSPRLSGGPTHGGVCLLSFRDPTSEPAATLRLPTAYQRGQRVLEEMEVSDPRDGRGPDRPRLDHG